MAKRRPRCVGPSQGLRGHVSYSILHLTFVTLIEYSSIFLISFFFFFFSLRIKTVQKSDAGLYSCRVPCGTDHNGWYNCSLWITKKNPTTVDQEGYQQDEPMTDEPENLQYQG